MAVVALASGCTTLGVTRTAESEVSTTARTAAWTPRASRQRLRVADRTENATRTAGRGQALALSR
jgi:hypothetical protein